LNKVFELIWTVIQFLTGIPDIVTEYLKIDAKAGDDDAPQSEGQTSYIFKGSIVFTTLVLLPLCMGLYLIGYHFWAAHEYHIYVWQFWKGFLKAIGLILFALIWQQTFHPFIGIYQLGVREFLGTTMFFTRCAPFFFRDRKESKIILIPGQLVADVETSHDPEDRFAVLADVKYRKKVRDDKGEVAEVEDSMRKIFWLRFSYKVDIYRQPKKVVQNYHKYFLDDYEKGVPKFTSLYKITDEAKGVLVGRVDEVTQKYFVEDLRMQGSVNNLDRKGIEIVNRELFDHIYDVFKDIGLLLVQISIEHIGDIEKGGYFDQKDRLEKESQQAEADAGIAISRARTDIIAAEQRQLAEIADAKSRTAIAAQEVIAAQAEIEVKKAETTRDQQPLLVLFELMQQPGSAEAAMAANLSLLVSRGDKEVLIPLAKSAGYNANDLTIVNVGEGAVGDIANAARLGAIQKLLPGTGLIPRTGAPAQTPVSTS